jgi:hypothetical protein
MQTIGTQLLLIIFIVVRVILVLTGASCYPDVIGSRSTEWPVGFRAMGFAFFGLWQLTGR